MTKKLAPPAVDYPMVHSEGNEVQPHEMRWAARMVGREIVQTLMEVMRTSESDTARIAAAKELRTLGYGLPQKESMEKATIDSNEFDAMGLDEQIETLHRLIGELEKKREQQDLARRVGVGEADGFDSD